MATRRATGTGGGTGDDARGLLRRHRAASAAVAVALLCFFALTAVLLAQPWAAHQRSSPGGRAHGPTTIPTSTTLPLARSTPALYPTYLPTGVARGSLVVDAWSPPTFGGYVQSYYGATPRGQSLPELVIGGPQAVQMFATSGHAPETTVLAGYPVTLWRIVTTEQATVSGGATVTGLAATVDGRAVSLIGVSLSDAELGAVLHGLRPRPAGAGWNTGALPATLVLVAQGERSEDPSFAPYRLQFAPDLVLAVTHDVVIPRGACVCNAESWPVSLTDVGPARAVEIDMLPAGGPSTQLHQIEWQYAPGADVTLTFGGISTDEALRIADSVRPAPAALWASLPCTKTSPGVGPVTCDPEREFPTSP